MSAAATGCARESTFRLKAPAAPGAILAIHLADRPTTDPPLPAAWRIAPTDSCAWNGE